MHSAPATCRPAHCNSISLPPPAAGFFYAKWRFVWRAGLAGRANSGSLIFFALIDIMTKKILVTGASGFIGSHTCVELLAAGFDVVAVDNLCNSAR